MVRDPRMATLDESVEQLTSIMWPLVGSLAIVTWLMVLACQFELGSTLSFGALFIFPLVCLALTACVHAVAVVVIQGILDRKENISAWSLMYGAWATVVWVPALVVLHADRSAWVAALLPLMAGLATALLYRWSRRTEHQQEFEGDLQSLFFVPAKATPGQTIFTVLLTSIAAECGLLALLARLDSLAALLLALACLLPVWRFLRAHDSDFGRRAPVLSSIGALLLTMIALLPFLKNGPGHDALDLLLQQLDRQKSAQATPRASNPGAGYSGIILLLPPKPPQTVLPPAPKADLPGRAKPQVIAFDGAYWYFKEPDHAPRPDAKTVHADPLKVHIQSTNRLALQMEAHQAIVPAVKMNCCSDLRLNITNADARPGLIAVEVVLRDTETKPQSATSLGTVVIPSSTTSPMDFLRQPVHETLTF